MTKDELKQTVIDVARSKYQEDGDIEIDDETKFSIADPPDDGLYVQAWVWVSLHDMPDGTTNDDIKLLQEIHCARCGASLKDGRCTDETCPFSDCAQEDPAGWVGHPEREKTDG